MRKSGFLISLIACGAMVLLGALAWPVIYPSSYKQEEEALIALALPKENSHAQPVVAIQSPDSQKDMETVEAFLITEKPRQALKVIRKYRQEMEAQTKEGDLWFDLLVKANVALKNTSQLTALYEYRPESFKNKEDAVIIIAHGFVSTGKVRNYNVLRQEWRGKEERPEEWLMLDTDLLLLDDKRWQAINLLATVDFEGKKDLPRLIRLGLLYMKEDPKSAWKYLNEAYQKDPTNPEIRLYRAKLLEMVGKPSPSLSEYLSAVQYAPEESYYRDQLADFYVRQGKYRQSLDLFHDFFYKGASENAWVKGLFLSHVIKPIRLDFSHMKLPEGNLRPFIDYLVHLKPWEFWNEEQYILLENSQHYLETQQAAWWLRLLSALKHDDQEAAETRSVAILCRSTRRTRYVYSK